MGTVYGPVSSWRLARSLDVDAVSSKGKTCSFDCVYCQLGHTVHPLTERRRFVEPAELHLELVQMSDVALDTVTFSGVGEPTLALNLAEMAEIARRLQPDEVQLNTPLRPSPVRPLSSDDLEQVETAFAGLPAINVFKAARPEVATIDEIETRRRRPAVGGGQP